MSSLSPPSSGASSSAPNVLSLTRRALASNQTYQESLGSLAESLRSELAAVEKLLEDVEQNVTSKGIDAVTRTWPDERVVLIKEGWVGLNSIIGRKQIFSEVRSLYMIVESAWKLSDAGSISRTLLSMKMQIGINDTGI